MKKMIYIAYCDLYNDILASYCLACTFNIFEARLAVDFDKHNKTKHEGKDPHWHITGRNLEVQEGQSAIDAYTNWAKDFKYEILPYPDYCEAPGVY